MPAEIYNVLVGLGAAALVAVFGGGMTAYTMTCPADSSCEEEIELTSWRRPIIVGAVCDLLVFAGYMYESPLA